MGHNSSSRQGLRVGAIAVAILLCARGHDAACLHAQDSPTAVPIESANEDLTASVRFEHDRALEDLLERTDAAMGQQNTADAVLLLDEVLAQAGSRLVLVEGTYRNAAAEANRRLAELPEAERRRYERIAGAAAESAIREARHDGDPRRMRELVVRYRHTSAGAQGLHSLAQAEFDRGHFDDCALFCAALVNESPQPERELATFPDLALLWCLAAIRSGNVVQARELRQRFASTLELVRLSDVDRTVADEIDRLLAAVAGAATADVDIVPDRLPSAMLAPAWSESTPAAVGGAFEAALHDLTENSVPPVSQLGPVVVPHGVACRTWDGIALLNVETGETLWRYPVPHLVAVNPNGSTVYERQIEGAVRRLLGDGVHTALVADAEHVYCVMPSAIDPTRADQSPQQNSLVALRCADGAVAWQFPSSPDSTADTGTTAASLSETFVRGPPTIAGMKLLVIAEQAGMIQLLSLDRTTGRLLDEEPLCSTETGDARDDRRLAQACSVGVAGSLAICPTGGGAVAAVDLAAQTMRWAFRYPRDRLRVLTRDAPLQHGIPAQFLWADGWRFPTLHADERHTVVASCESDRLFVLRSNTGELLWSAPREDGLYVAAASDGRIVVAGRSELRAYNVEDGQIVWRAATGPIAGRGFATPTHYVVPLKGDAVAAVRFDNGEVARTWPKDSGLLPTESPDDLPHVEPVSLAWTPAGIVAQSLTRIWRPETLAAARAVADDQKTAAERAEILREAGDFVAAQNALLYAPQTGPDPTDDEINARISDIGLQYMVANPDLRDDAYLWFLGFTLDNHRQRNALHWQWLSMPRDWTGINVFEAPEGLDFENSPRFYVLDHDQAGHVRLDRGIQGRFWEQRTRLSPAEKAEWDQRIDEGLIYDYEAAKAGRPPTPDPRLADLFDHFPVGQQLRLEQPQRWTSTPEFIRTQLRLLQQSHIAEPPLAAAALRQLATLYTEHSDPHDAAAVYQRLQDKFADVTLPDGTSTRAIVEQVSLNPAVASALAAGDRWPHTEPEITSRPWPEGEIYYLPVAVQHDGGGLFDRLNVAVHRLGGMVRFSGAGMPRPWALELPHIDNPLRSGQSYPDLRRAWGFGQFLVLQVGAEVFGIAPFNAAGEPQATLVWPPPGESIGTTSEPAYTHLLDNLGRIEVRVAPFDEGVDRHNEFGHLVGRVGPVRSGYFCVQRSGVLIAFDAATGVELWRRRNLSPSVRCYGDDHTVILHDPAHRQFTRLSALDGRPRDAAPLAAPAETWLATVGCRVLLERSTPPGTATKDYELSSFDLSHNIETWRRRFPARSVCFPVDDRSCGVLAPNGALEFLRLSDGEAIATHTVQAPQPLIHVRSIVDPERIIIIVSGTRQDDGLEAATRGGGVFINEGYRRLIVNGEWSAFDRRTGDHLWTRAIDNASLLLDQPLDVPILVCNEQRYPPEKDGQRGATFGRVRVFDRRSGDLLFDEPGSGVHNYYLVERDIDAGWVELRLPGRVVRFDYRGAAEH